MMELPPRARRILQQGIDPSVFAGTTSACAENTSMWWRHAAVGGNYLRVRGEYFLHLEVAVEGKELPPRARRIPS